MSEYRLPLTAEEIEQKLLDVDDKVCKDDLPSCIEDALAEAKLSGEFDGKDGDDGISPVVSVTTITGGHRITITDKNGTKTVDVMDGVDGRGIKSIARTSGNGASGTTDTYTIAYTDNTTSTFTVYNGKDGADGFSPTISFMEFDTGTTTGITVSITDENGTQTFDVLNGTNGRNGTSVTITDTIQSDEDGGTNEVVFSNGARLIVKNGSKGDAGTNGKDYSFNPTVYDLPVLYLTGDISPIKTSKDNEVSLTYVYGERSGSCTLKGQGASSYQMAMNFINAGKAGKFNYTIKFDNAFEAKEGWGSQKKYCLKANWIDHSHSRNIVSCKLWGMSVKARSTVPTELASLPNGGAIDGFPIVIMVNDEFHGLYTFNIPKDGWMLGLTEDTTKTQAIFSAHQHSDATQFKGLLKGDESDFELEFISDEDNADWATASLNNLIQACMDSWGGDLDTEVAKYLDWDSAIDYYIHCVVEKGSDAVDKNFLLVTFDGTKWYFTNYDRDTICGLAWDGSALDRPVSDVKFVDCKNTSRVFELIYRFKTDALKARYQQLRSNILSESRINQIYENFAWAIPSPVAQEDVKKYPTIRGSFVNGVDQICRWMRQRLEACDEWINALPAQETPVEPVEMVNLVPTSTDTDGSIYNGVGYKENVRLSSGGGVSSSAQNGTVTVGFMPWQRCGVIRIKGATFPFSEAEHYYVIFYNGSKGKLYAVDDNAVHDGTGTTALIKHSYDESSGVTTIDFSGLASSQGTEVGDAVIGADYFRICAKGEGADLIVTVNQEITV